MPNLLVEEPPIDGVNPDVTAAQPAAPSQPAAATDASGFFAADVKICKYCGRDPDKDCDVEVTTDDKLAFVEALLRLDRFRKTYTLFGGRLEVGFRTLTSAEYDLCYTQAALTAEAGLAAQLPKAPRSLNDLISTLSVDFIRYGDKTYTSPEAISGWPFDPPAPAEKSTVLIQIANYVYDNYLPQAVIRDAVNEAYWRFVALVKKIVVMKNDPSF